MEVTIDASVILPAYQHLLNDPGPYVLEFLYGGRDSGKSYTVAELLVIECLELSYFRCALIREQSGDIKDSQWQLIKDIVEDWGLSSLFTFLKAPLEIICFNGNKFICRGCNEPQNLKSITACNRAWIEEGLKDLASFTVILTTLRSNDSAVKVYYTFNPECEGNYQNFWLYQDWFSSNSYDLSFTSVRTFDVEVKGVKKQVKLNYRVTHSTYHDNPFVSDERIAFHENNKGYYYTVYTLGRWGYKITGGEFWTQFKSDKHTKDIEWINSPLCVALDSNVTPYVTQALWQIDTVNKELRQFDEIPCPSPNSSAPKAARQFIKWMQRRDYRGKIYVYGDPAANARSVVDENNSSFFEKYIEVLEDEGYHVVNMVERSHPRVGLSGDFVNEIYENGYDGWSIVINSCCQVSIEDYTMCKKDKDGGILKKRITDKETGQSYEQYGHYSDAKRYFVTSVLKDEFKTFADRGRRKISYT